MRRRDGTWLAIAAILSGCGGSGGGGGGSGSPPVVTVPGPTPAATPTPVPTATPTPAGSQPTLLTLGVNTDLVGWRASSDYARNPDGSVAYVSDYYVGATRPVTYIASDNEFFYRANHNIVPGQNGESFSYRRTSQSSATFSQYSATVGPVSYQLTELVIGRTNPLLPLFYSSLAVLRASAVDPRDGLTKVSVEPVAFGVGFPWSTVRLTGTVQYRGIVVGHARGVGSNVYEVGGTFEATINYDTGTIDGQVALLGKDERTGETVDLGQWPLRSSGGRTTLDSFYADVDDARRSRFQGVLAGSLGEELTGGLDIVLADPRAPAAMMKASMVMAARK